MLLQKIFEIRCKFRAKMSPLIYRGAEQHLIGSSKRLEEMIMAIQIRKAQRSLAKLKIGLAGSSGSGKTLSSLLLGYG